MGVAESRLAVECNECQREARSRNHVLEIGMAKSPPKGPHRSASSGRYVTTQTAVRNPKGTVSEPRKK